MEYLEILKRIYKLIDKIPVGYRTQAKYYTDSAMFIELKDLLKGLSSLMKARSNLSDSSLTELDNMGLLLYEVDLILTDIEIRKMTSNTATFETDEKKHS